MKMWSLIASNQLYMDSIKTLKEEKKIFWLSNSLYDKIDYNISFIEKECPV